MQGRDISQLNHENKMLCEGDVTDFHIHVLTTELRNIRE